MKDAEQVEVLGERDGVKLVSFADAQTLNTAEIIAQREYGKRDTGDRTLNPDGSPARSRCKAAVVNVDALFDNRYRRIKGNKLEIVTDYRAIREQSRGQIYAKQIPCYVVSRDAEGNLKLDKTETVSDTDFIADFTHKLSKESMVEVLPLISDGGTEVTTDEIPI